MQRSEARRIGAGILERAFVRSGLGRGVAASTRAGSPARGSRPEEAELEIA